jgi:hypothetical protein
MLLSALVAMASCAHTSTDYQECEATLYRERVAWQLERARLESELNALHETLISERAERLAASMLTTKHKRDDPTDGRVVSHTGNASARPVQPSRTLLQAEAAKQQCSMDELLAMQSADPVAALTAMFVTNVGCAMCLIPCGSAANAALCAFGCLKPDEGVCTEDDRAAIQAVGMPSSLADRAQLVRMLEVAGRACVGCILESIASVCGTDCMSERLHIIELPFTHTARLCLPELVARLSAGEASAFAQAVAVNEPFGLTVAVATGSSTMTDLFVPTAGPLPQHKVYRGVDTGTIAYECDPAAHGRVWAVLPTSSFATEPTAAISPPTSSGGEPSWADCSGAFRIDLVTGEAHSQPAKTDGSSRVPIRFDLQWADCSTLLPFDSSEPSAETKTLNSGANAASCWLSRFFGAQAAKWQGAPAFAIELQDDSVALQTDLVVRSGTVLRVTSSANTTIVVGPHQIRVELGARLEIEGITIADSVQSSALVVRGAAWAARCTFARCSATTNIIAFGLFDEYIPDGVGAFLAAGGAAVHLIGSMEIVDSALLECSAGGAKVAALGAAIFSFGDAGAQLEIRGSELRRNWVIGGSFGCLGGAVFIFGTNVTLQNSIVSENSARDGGQNTFGGAVCLMYAQMGVYTSEVRNNSATSDGQYVYGGAFFLGSGQLIISADSLLSGNLVNARSAAGRGYGGAIFITSSGSGSQITVRPQLTVKQTVLQNNTARGGLLAAGGAAYLRVADADVVQSTFEANSASFGTSSSGGAVAVETTILRIRDSEFRANSVTGDGGAVYLDGDSAVFTRVSFVRNRAVASKGSSLSAGGALKVKLGLVRLDGCLLHDNIAESLLGAIYALGGGVHVEAGNVHIERSTMQGNRMGGPGTAQADWSGIGGAHVHADGGDVVMDGCNVTDDGDGEEASIKNAAKCLLMAKQSLVLNSNSFSSMMPGRVLLTLKSGNAGLQLLIRRCTVSNLPILSDQPNIMIGIVNSTFTPALDPSVPTVQPNPNCGVKIAGSPLCDPRATCYSSPSGGVQCACTGQGLREKAGTFRRAAVRTGRLAEGGARK